MNIADIRLIFEAKGLHAAIEELHHYPECTMKLNKLIMDLLKEEGPDFKFDPGFHYDLTRHHRAVNWLLTYSQSKDIKTAFEEWLNRLEDGFWLPAGPLERLAVLCDLVKIDEPVFQFNCDNLTPEQRFLVDFGFAQITRDEAL